MASELTDVAYNPVIGSDGCHYFVVPYTKAYGPSNRAYLKLVKYDPGDGSISNIAVDTSSNGDGDIDAYCVAINPAKTVIYIYWSGLTSAASKRACYNTYTIATSILGTAGTFATALSSTEYTCFCTCVDSDGTIYLAAKEGAASNGLKVYKSTNGTTYTTDTTIVTTTASSACKIIINQALGISLVYDNSGLYVKEKTGGYWGPAKLILATKTYYDIVAAPDDDYIIFAVSAVMSAYKRNNGNWDLVKSSIVTATASPFSTTVTPSGTILLVYAGSSNVSMVEGSGSTWSAASILSATETPSILSLSRSDISNISLWAKWGNVSWQTYKITPLLPNATYPLAIRTVDDNGQAIVYQSSESIITPDYKPFEGTPPARGLIKSGQVEIEAYGSIQLSNIETIIKPIY